MRNSISYRLWGRYALFSDPVMRVGGEKCSYSVPTYQALKGITESIYWKPTIIWIVDRVHVLNKIRTQSMGIKTRKLKGPFAEADLSMYSYLFDVAYEVEAHFEFNLNRPELEQDRNEHKHHNIAKRMVQRGGRRDIFLGTRECQGYVEPCVFGENPGYYDDMDEIPLGTMVHGIDYPDETTDGSFGVRLWQPVMKKGIITFPRPALLPPGPSLADDKIVVRTLDPMTKKDFSYTTLETVEEVYDEIFGGEG